jgi:hypothetical protein
VDPKKSPLSDVGRAGASLGARPRSALMSDDLDCGVTVDARLPVLGAVGG